MYKWKTDLICFETERYLRKVSRVNLQDILQAQTNGVGRGEGIKKNASER